MTHEDADPLFNDHESFKRADTLEDLPRLWVSMEPTW